MISSTQFTNITWRLTTWILLTLFLLPLESSTAQKVSTVPLPVEKHKTVFKRTAPNLINRSPGESAALPPTADQIVFDQAKDFSALPSRKSFPVSPALKRLFSEIENGKAHELYGAYVPGVFALPIIQQPAEDPIFVSRKMGVITQFQLAAKNGVTGLLAHNYLSGKEFYKLEIGQEVWMIFGDRSIKRYRVTDIQRYQKMKPNSLRSDYLDLQTRRTLTTSQVFGNFYRGEDRVVFQTCLEGEGKLNWGLVFISASPISENL
jgi:hypothetical protein